MGKLSKLAAIAVIGGAVAATTADVTAAGVAPQPNICERVCWSARAPQCSISQEPSLNRAIVHHTASSADYNTTSLDDSKARVRAHQNYHMDTNGWCDIGYHFLVDKLGNLFEGRDGSMTSYPRGAHDGANTQSMGFSCMAYFHTPYNNEPTPALLDSLYDCIAWRMPQGWAGPYGYPNCNYGSQGVCVGYVDSHRRVKATACPGDLMHNPYIGNDVNSGIIRAEIGCRVDGSCGAPPSAPAAPSALSATAASSSQINLTWTDNSNNEDNFVVARSSTAGGPYTDIATVGANSTSYSDTGLAASTSYYYVVRAVNGVGASANSNEASATTLAPAPPAPAAPSNLTGTAIDRKRVDLAWTDNSADEDNFVLERRLGTGAYGVIATLGANVTSYSDTGVTRNKTYTYRVKATNAGGSSAYSNEATVTTPK